MLNLVEDGVDHDEDDHKDDDDDDDDDDGIGRERWSNLKSTFYSFSIA